MSLKDDYAYDVQAALFLPLAGIKAYGMDVYFTEARESLTKITHRRLYDTLLSQQVGHVSWRDLPGIPPGNPTSNFTAWCAAAEARFTTDTSPQWGESVSDAEIRESVADVNVNLGPWYREWANDLGVCPAYELLAEALDKELRLFTVQAYAREGVTTDALTLSGEVLSDHVADAFAS